MLNFGYDPDYKNYCLGITDLKFYSGFYTEDLKIIDSFIGGERVKKSYWKFDELNASGGFSDSWRTRNS